MKRFAAVLLSLSLGAVCAGLVRAQEMPQLGQYVYVEELPAPVHKVEPVMPRAAIEAGVEGSVLVQVLLDTLGNVVRTQVTKSIPLLDDAAEAAVRQWRFKPAQAGGHAVPVWVAIPVLFRLPRVGAPEGAIRDGTALPPPGDRPLPIRGLRAGLYRINDRNDDLVRITEIDHGHVKLESPGQWVGSGVVQGDTYWGVFVYRDDAPEAKNRGARGTHFGTIQPDGRVIVTGTFTNRTWPTFHSQWVPPRAHAAKRDTMAIDLDRLRRLPVQELSPRAMLRHPVWPPEGDSTATPRYGHPVWPPEQGAPDARIELAKPAEKPAAKKR